jgi:hypothetical protein
MKTLNNGAGTTASILCGPGNDERKEARPPEDSDSVFSDFNNEVFFGLRTHVREPYYLAQPVKKPVAVPQFFSPEPISAFRALPPNSSLSVYGDRESRLRGMMLDAASCIDILTGEQQRRIQEYLQGRFGGDLSTRDEWQKFFTRPNPENVPYDDWQKRRSYSASMTIPMSCVAKSPRWTGLTRLPSKSLIRPKSGGDGGKQVTRNSHSLKMAEFSS